MGDSEIGKWQYVTEITSRSSEPSRILEKSIFRYELCANGPARTDD